MSVLACDDMRKTGSRNCMLRLLLVMGICSAGSFGETRPEELFRVTSGQVDFRVLSEKEQPYWIGYSGVGSAPLVFRLKHGSGSASYYDCVGKVCGVLLEGLSVRPMRAKRICMGSESKVCVFFKEGGDRVDLIFAELTVSLSFEEANKLCDSLTGYWRKVSKDAGND